MSRPLPRVTLALLAATTLLACSTGPKLPSMFLNPLNRLTAEEGQRMVDEGRRVANAAEADIERGEQLVKDGRARLKVGEELMSRGRTALRAAAMAEEAERLKRTAEELKHEALP